MGQPLIWMVDGWQTPPMGKDAGLRAGYLIREIQKGVSIGIPDSRPTTVIGKGVHELRIRDGEQKKTWRIIYRVDSDAILVV
jgi:phage-related protein